MKRLALLFVLTAAASLHAQLVPFTPPRIGSRALPILDYTVASNGIDYLAAWTASTSQGAAIYAQRIHADGSLDGELPKLIEAPHGLYGGAPSLGDVKVAGAPSGYLLAWASSEGLTLVFTDANGGTKRRSVIGIAPAAQTLVAANAGTFLVVSGFRDAMMPFTATLLDSEGTVVQSLIPRGGIDAEPGTAALVAEADGYLVLCTKWAAGGTDLYGRRISTSGTTGDWFRIGTLPAGVTTLAAWYDGSRDAIAWIGNAGAVSGAVGTMSLDPRSGIATAPKFVFSDASQTAYHVTFAQRRLWIQTVSLSSPGKLVSMSPDGTDVQQRDSNTGWRIAIAESGSSLLFLLEPTSSAASPRILAARFQSPSAPDIVVTRAASMQTNGTLIDGGSNALAVWVETVPADHVFAKFVGTDGAPVGDAIDVSPNADLDAPPDGAFNGTTYLIVWQWFDQILARRVSSAGVVLDAEDIVIATDASGAKVASNGNEWIVLWSKYTQPSSWDRCGRSSLYGTRVSANGTPLDSGVAIAPDSWRSASTADVAWNGSKYVVAWSNYVCAYHSQPYLSYISAAVVDPDLRRIVWSTLTPDTTYWQPDDQHVSHPLTAAIDGRSVAVWTRGMNATDYRLIGESFGTARKRAAGEYATVPSLTGALIAAAPASDGRLFLLSMTTAYASFSPPDRRIFRTAISSDGTSSSPELVLVPDAYATLTGRAIVRANRLWISESRFDPALGADRLYVRQVP